MKNILKFRKIITMISYIVIFWLLFDISILNIEKLAEFKFGDIYAKIFLVYIFGAIIFWIISKISKNFFSKETNYIIQFILFFSILLVPWIFINHHFLAQHLWESNLYLRVYGKIAMLYFAIALIISPILQFIKNEKWREYLILSRKFLGILSFIFFLKHWLEYFSLEYIFQQNYHSNIPYFNYIYENALKRWDVISWIIPWILMVVLWVTSNEFSQKFLWWRRWKNIQSLVFPAFLFSVIHIAFASRFEWFYVFLISLVVIARITAYLNRKQRRSSWKIVWYRCIPCWYIYDEKVWDLDSWILPGTKFEDIPDDWRCPICGVSKDDFEPVFDWDEIEIKSEIVGYTMLTKNVLELKIKVKTYEKIEVKPWQFADIIFNSWEFRRSYSVVYCKDNVLTFWIKLKSNWKGSNILKNKKLWDTLVFWGIFW